MTDLIGHRLGDFEMVRELGRGGMGVVYEARQISLNRRVALKVLSGGLGLTAKAVQRFRREAEAAAKLHHTNIVPVYATGEQDGTHFYAMELIDGPSLDQVIGQMRQGNRSRGRQPPESSLGGLTPPAQDPDALPAPELIQTGPYIANANIAGTSSGLSSSSLGSGSDYFDTVARMVAEVADALDYAHKEGVIHRDIKPSNLLLSPAGRLSVNDFGLARMLEQPGMTMTGEFVGTPAYMSPEQITAGRIPLDHRTDIYSLGATLYELLTLHPPFTGASREQVLAQIVQKEPKAPRHLLKNVPIDLETICLKCLEKDPDRRYQSAGELAEDLRRYVHRFAISARRAGPITKLKKWAKRNPALSAAGLALVLALALAGVFAWQMHKRGEEAAIEKRQAALEKAILAAMSSQFTDADAALLEAERLGADLAQRRFVAGILKHYRGDSDEAKRLLLEACGQRPDWVAPRAFLAVVCNDTHDFLGKLEHGHAALRLTPKTDEDYLFLGLMVGTDNPRRAMPDVDEGWNRRHSVLAQFVRAQVLSSLADDTGRIEDASAAREAFQSARPFLADAPLATATGLFIHCVVCNNCRIHGRKEEAERWLAEGLADFKAAGQGACRNHPQALAGRSKYLYLREGSPESLDAENRELGRRGPESEACRVYLASLLRRDKTDEALEYLHGFADKSYHLAEYRVVFLMSRDVATARAECRRVVADTTRRGWRGYLIYALNMVGLPDEVPPLIADPRSAAPGVAEWQDIVPFLDRMFAHIYQGRPLDVEAEIAGSRWKRQLAYGALGFAALGRGEREKARVWFGKSNEHPPLSFSSYLWVRAIRERVLADDPVWPPWLAKKK